MLQIDQSSCSMTTKDLEARGWDTLQHARIKRALSINAAAAAASRRRRASLASGCPLRVAADGYER